MSRRISFTEQRRRKLARRVDALERLESRNMIMDGLFSLSPSAVVPLVAVGTLAAGEAVRRSAEQHSRHELRRNKDRHCKVCFSRAKAFSAGLDRDNRRKSGHAILTDILRLRTLSGHPQEFTR
jgi:hypothetical protein